MIDISISTFFITLINIGILFLVLRKVLFKRVTCFMEERADAVRRTLEEAERSKAEAADLLREYREHLKNREEAGAKIMQAATEKANAEAERIVAAALRDAEALKANARARIEAEQQAALAKFRSEAAALVVAAASRILQRELTQEDNRRFAGILLQEIGKR
ncbi:MAG: ATP synthase F0 subunit B [Spirochaetaceae bacterium]|nr:ATP synthase F0 subunit B [Spirochaetaceae bacterium]